MMRRSCCLALCLTTLFSACNASPQDLQPVIPVDIQLYYNQRPLEDAQVALHPAGEPEGKIVARPNGFTDSSGRVRLTTYYPGDGAPEGEYTVTLIWAPIVGTVRGENEEREPDRFRGQYSNPAVSPLRLSISKNTPMPIRIDLP